MSDIELNKVKYLHSSKISNLKLVIILQGLTYDFFMLSINTIIYYTSSLHFHSKAYKVNVHNHYQDYNADFCEDKIIPHSGKVQAEKLLHKRKKRKCYWILNKAFIHNSEPFSSY